MGSQESQIGLDGLLDPPRLHVSKAMLVGKKSGPLPIHRGKVWRWGKELPYKRRPPVSQGIPALVTVGMEATFRQLQKLGQHNCVLKYLSSFPVLGCYRRPAPYLTALLAQASVPAGLRDGFCALLRSALFDLARRLGDFSA
jgi:hypothetical protein